MTSRTVYVLVRNAVKTNWRLVKVSVILRASMHNMHSYSLCIVLCIHSYAKCAYSMHSTPTYSSSTIRMHTLEVLLSITTLVVLCILANIRSMHSVRAVQCTSFLKYAY